MLLKLNLQFFASKKGGGSTKNGRDSESKRLGAKAADGQFVTAGSILYRQRGTKILPGTNVMRGGDDTLFTTVSGIVKFERVGKDNDEDIAQNSQKSGIFIRKYPSCSPGKKLSYLGCLTGVGARHFAQFIKQGSGIGRPLFRIFCHHLFQQFSSRRRDIGDLRRLRFQHQSHKVEHSVCLKGFSAAEHVVECRAQTDRKSVV